MLYRQNLTLFCKLLSGLKLPICKASSYYVGSQTVSKFTINKATSVEPSKHIVYWNMKITENGRNGNIQLAESIFDHMPCKNTVSWTAMLTAYAENGQVRKAREVFDQMPGRTTASYNAMITAYIRNNCNVDEAYRLFSVMHDRNGVSYAVMITGFVRAGIFDDAEKLYLEIPLELRDPVASNALLNGYLKIGKLNEALRIFEGMVKRDVVTWSSMLHGLCKNGRIVDAKNLFDRMPEKNIVSWTTIIDGYMESGYFKEGFDLFIRLRREGVLEVNSTNITTMFKACGSNGRILEGMQVHGLVMRLGFDFDVILGNSVITMYCRLGCTDAAQRIFSNMDVKDIVSWNSLLSGYVENCEVDEAYKLFERMPVKDLISWTAMINGLSVVGKIEKCLELFAMMPKKDDIVWTAVISGFVNNGQHEEAFNWYIQMLHKGYKPNPLTYTSMLAASAALVTMNQGTQIHAHVVKRDLESDTSIQNSLVSMYSKCGNIIDAYKIFTGITEPNVVSYNSVITGFAQNGYGDEALSIYKRMQNKGYAPNDVTYLAILSACTHAGLVEEGWTHFTSMRSLYQIEPGADHYACMVDLLGRAGLLDKAVELIHSMPVEPHCGIWGALLSASTTHFRLDLAELAAQHLAQLQPENATPYVVLSKFYSVAGNENGGDQIRKEKNTRRLKKSPGCSWIIVKDEVHLFLVGDQSHTDIRCIRTTLLTLEKEMQRLASCVQ